MRSYLVTAITVTWLIAGAVIFLAGRHVGETNTDGPRYAECRTFFLISEWVWVCPMERA